MQVTQPSGSVLERVLARYVRGGGGQGKRVVRDGGLSRSGVDESSGSGSDRSEGANADKGRRDAVQNGHTEERAEQGQESRKSGDGSSEGVQNESGVSGEQKQTGEAASEALKAYFTSCTRCAFVLVPSCCAYSLFLCLSAATATSHLHIRSELTDVNYAHTT